MSDIVFNADSYETLLNEAKDLGFTFKDNNGNDQILVNGPMLSGGSYFLNYVGPVDGLSGVWGRLRANGELSDLPAFSSKITQYIFSEQLFKWINIQTGNDAPNSVENIGVIA